VEAISEKAVTATAAAEARDLGRGMMDEKERENEEKRL
jgi:hypothetical protein